MPPTDLNLETVLSVLELLPTPAMLVDTSYGVRARNRAMDKLLDSRRPGQVTDSVGDLLRCMHARKGGCGSHKSCGACRLIKAVTTAAEHGGREQAIEVRIAQRSEGMIDMRAFLLGASPMTLRANKMALVTLQDVSASARDAERGKLHTSLELLDAIGMGVVVIDPKKRVIVHANESALTALGRVTCEIEQEPCRSLLCTAEEGSCPLLDIGLREHVEERTLTRRDGRELPVEVSARFVQHGGQRLVLESFWSLTERRASEQTIRRHNERLEALMELSRRREESDGDLLQWAVQQAVGLTHSKAGYLYLVSRDQRRLRLQACWTHGDRASLVAGLPGELHTNEAGLWVDAVRMNAPVTYNTYDRMVDEKPDRKTELPFERHLAVPINQGSSVVALLGVGNKVEHYDDRDSAQLGLFASSAWEMVRRRRAESKLRRSVDNLRQLLQGSIEAITRAVEIRDPYTAGHQQRVSNLARAIAVELGLDRARVDAIRIAAVLHDIGKIAIPTDILTKPGRLTALQFALMRLHPIHGAEILGHVSFPFDVHTIVRQHHERLDGSGYPMGLEGEAICLEARIIAVADVMEAMSSHRPYRPARAERVALLELEKQRGKGLDTMVVDACLRLFRDGRFSFE